MHDNLMEYIRLDSLRRKLMYVGWDKHGLTCVQPLRDEIDSKLEILRNQWKEAKGE